MRLIHSAAMHAHGPPRPKVEDQALFDNSLLKKIETKKLPDRAKTC